MTNSTTTTPTTMRAVIQDRYGSSEVLRLARVARPVIADNEVLVQVHAAGLDRGTEHLMTGKPYIMRLGFGLRRPRNPVSGRDVAGTLVSAGESVNTLIADPPPGAPVPPILPPKEGFLALDKDKFAASFAADVDPDSAAFMADSQVPWGLDALGGSITVPAWKTKPSWYLVATDDRMIPPPAQRAMAARAGATVIETPGSHSVYVSQPGAVAGLIQKAAESVAALTR